MTPAKRMFDLLVAILLSIFLLPVLLVTSVIILIVDGGPVFYISERMKSPSKAFQLVKFRTMKPSVADSGISGGDKSARITRLGPFLRRSRLDEVPQLWNVLRGDISFVGPRPPLRQYVDRFPDLYQAVLKSRPGITGLASVYFHAHEEHLVARSQSAAETDAIYCRACVPRKAKLDLIYQSRRSLCMDVSIMLKTVFRSLR